MTCKSHKNSKSHYNDETKLSVSKFDDEISKTANRIVKILGTVKKIVSYLQNKVFCISKLLNFLWSGSLWKATWITGLKFTVIGDFGIMYLRLKLLGKV